MKLYVMKRLDNGQYYKATGGLNYRWVSDLRDSTFFKDNPDGLRAAVAKEINSPTVWRRTSATRR